MNYDRREVVATIVMIGKVTLRREAPKRKQPPPIVRGGWIFFGSYYLLRNSAEKCVKAERYFQAYLSEPLTSEK